MGLTDLIKKDKVESVLGIDVSTQSFAYCLYDSTGPVQWGEIKFKGDNVYARLADGQRKVAAIAAGIKADLVVAEGAIYVQNKKTVILLSYALGAIIAALYNEGMKIEEISPITWQNAIGNKALTKAEKLEIETKTPGKSKTWYTAKYRELRKQRTMDFVKNTLGVDTNNDNVGDALAIAHVAYHKHCA